MTDLSDALDVHQAAARLGVSRPEMYRLIGSGAVSAHKFADRWAIPVEAVRRAELSPRPIGRPFSIAASWALLRLVSHLDVPELSPSRRSQLRRHLRDDDDRELAGRLRARASRRSLFAHPSSLPRLLADRAIVPSGTSALDEVDADLVIGGAPPAEGYVHARDEASLFKAHSLMGGLGATNVLLHVVDDAVDVPLRVGVAVPAVVALDLIESGDPRSVGAGWTLWSQALAEVRRGR